MIKKRIFNICSTLLFEINDMTLWNDFRGTLKPYLENMRLNRGLKDYQIIMDQATQDEADNDYTVKGIVKVAPQRVGEYFVIDFSVNSSLVNVEEE